LKRWYAKSTITRELLKRGWQLINCGPDWDAFTVALVGGDHCSPFAPCLQIFWGERPEAKLTSRNRRLPAIHFQSYSVRLAKPGDFEVLEKEVNRLRALTLLDIDALTRGEG
jgi:hypothetical protein